MRSLQVRIFGERTVSPSSFKVPAFAVLAFGAIAGCTTMTSTTDPVYLRLQDLDARLGRIEKVVNNQSLVQLASQVDQLQAETKELRGEIETLQHDSQMASDRQRQLYLDVDRRLQALEQGGGRSGFSPAPGQPGTSQNGAGGPANPLGGSAAGQNGGASGAAQNAGAGPAGPGNSAGQAAASSASGAPAAVSGTDQQNYQAAFNLLQARHYPEAAQAFMNFLAAFPQSALADNAQYWLAETRYVQRDFPSALTEFQKVIDQYPQSAKIPDALLKVGYCNYELKQWDQARAALQKVTQDYPDTTAARLAQQRLDLINQQKG